MLAKRVLTAAVALPLAIIAILFLPRIGLACLVALIMLLGAWEWCVLTALKAGKRSGFMVVCLLVMIAVIVAPYFLGVLLLGLSALFWLGAIGLIVSYPAGWARTLGHRLPSSLAGLIILTAPVAAVMLLDGATHGAVWILVLCCMVWGADTGAYAAGRTYGRNRLVPRVSPGKTREGALGGIVVALFIGGVAAWMLGLGGASVVAMAVLGAWTAMISIVGDLTASMFKRSAGVKDSGHLFPGHGGVLDRLDSLLAATPWFVIGLNLIPHLA